MKLGWGGREATQGLSDQRKPGKSIVGHGIQWTKHMAGSAEEMNVKSWNAYSSNP